MPVRRRRRGEGRLLVELDHAHLACGRGLNAEVATLVVRLGDEVVRD